MKDAATGPKFADRKLCNSGLWNNDGVFEALAQLAVMMGACSLPSNSHKDGWSPRLRSVFILALRRV